LQQVIETGSGLVLFLSARCAGGRFQPESDPAGTVQSSTGRKLRVPVVSISIPRGKPPEYLGAISAVIDSAMFESVGLPSHCQIVSEHEPEDTGSYGRSEEKVNMLVLLRSARLAGEKAALVQQVLKNLAASPSLASGPAVITLVVKDALG
jgi:hypothetical protein